MNGTHRQAGIFIAHGEAAADLAPASLSRVAPALATAMGLRWQPGADSGEPFESPYSQEESDMVAARLRALGYLD